MNCVYITFEDLRSAMANAVASNTSNSDLEGLESLQLKNSRSGHVARLTSLYRTIESLTVEFGNMEEVSTLMAEVEESFRRFQTVHHKYFATFNESTDQEREVRYYDEQFRRKLLFQMMIEQWFVKANASARSEVHEETEVRPEDSGSVAGSHRHLSARSDVHEEIDFASVAGSQRRLTARSEVRGDLEVHPEDSVSVAGSQRSRSSSTIKKVMAKQALARLKLYQLKEKQELMRQEEEMKLQRQVLEAKYELEQAELQVRFLAEENPALTHGVPRIVNKPGPFTGVFEPRVDGVNAHAVSKPKEANEEIFRGQSKLNPNAREFTHASIKPDSDLSCSETGDSAFAMVEDMLGKLGSTIRQGFALPKPDLSAFDGNPLEYWSFIRTFENSIERNAANESEKLTYLLQYTTGEAKKTIKCCTVMDSSKGYQAARKLLKERFGHPFTIAAKHVSKLTEGPPIKSSDRSGLLAFADQLKDCEHTLESIGYLDEINSADNLRRIVQRLPFHLRTKFVEVADSIQQSGKRPSIRHISAFVETKARAANNPVFGGVMDATHDSKQGPTKPRSGGKSPPPKHNTTLNTQGSTFSQQSNTSTSGSGKELTSAKSSSCPACNWNHSLLKCQNFAKKTFDERVQLMRKAQLCHNCFQYGHISLGCLSKSACQKEGCTRRHHTLLHPPRQQVPNSTAGSEANTAQATPATQATQASQAASPESGQSNNTLVGGEKVCLRIVPVKVHGQGSSKELQTYALLDNGSDVSLCDKGLAAQLGVQGDERKFYLTTQETRDSPKIGQEISLTVEALDGSDKLEIKRLWTVDKLNASSHSIPTDQDIRRWPHLRDINLPSMDETKIELIIGCNAPEAFWVLEERRGNRGDPYAIRSPLGWTLMGPMDRVDYKECRHSVNFTRVVSVEREEDVLMQQLERFWKTDNAGLIPDSKVSMSVEDKRAIAVMESSAKMVDGHYQIALPWREQVPNLSNNRVMAERRLDMLKKRFLQDAELFEKYKATVGDYICKGHAARVPENELDAKGKPLWYLPHHPVFNPNKPGKTRVVFDCAAKFRGVSLNDQLLSGPDLTNSIVGVLTRFRQEQVALAADVESMFHQVTVSPNDYDAFRFLWWPDNDLHQDPVDHRMEVHLFGATSSPSCSNFALRKTADDNKDDFDEEVVETVKKNFYVDDCLKSVATPARAVNVANQLRDLLSKGGFRLVKWLCNKACVLETIPARERAPSVLDLDLDKERLPVERTLGLKWDMQKDQFMFSTFLKDKPNTRRGILSLTSSIYDPLGFLVPIILPAKKLLQDLCRQKLDWDEHVGVNESQRWEKWKEQLPKLSQVVVTRCVKPDKLEVLKSAELHNFADASQFAFGAVSYLRLVDVKDNVYCSFLMGKSRLAHIRPMTVPRLELSAAVLAVQLDKTLRAELEIPVQQSFFWSDSTSVLQYIRNESTRFHTFVANRLTVIHENSEPDQWKYVNSELNPADDASRGLTVDAMIQSNRWLNGPEFLTKEKDLWPCEPSHSHSQELSVDDPEVKRDVQTYSQTSSREHTEDVLSRLIQRFSSWVMLRKAFAWLLRFKEWLVRNHRVRSANSCASISQSARRELSVHEVQVAEKEIIRHVQKLSFSDVVEALKEVNKNQESSRQVKTTLKKLKTNTSLHKLSPMLDDEGILRVGGRLQNATIDYEAKHQIILPYRHHITSLIIQKHHQEAGHLGQEYVLSSLRQFYWIVKGRSAVRRVLSECFLCRKHGAARGEQLMANLPKERLTPEDPPFTSVGVDYFGPLYVKQGRSQVKRYGCVFTCLATRAAHIEIAHSLETDAFVNALRRFVSLRGNPTTIYSDNGTNFCAGEKEIRTSINDWNQRAINEFLRQRNITWKFNPPSASHMGGVWERLIRSIRKILKALLGQQLVNDEMLRTVMAEVQGILNSRPLTPISSDPKDLEPLTPNHLLLLRENPNLPPGFFTKEDSYSKRRWRQVQYMSDLFWKRWLSEYLPTLQQRQKWYRPRRCFAVNDLVLVVDEGVHRGKWPLARIIEVHRGKDGYVRSAKIRTSTSTLVRPITKLCFLEHDVQQVTEEQD